MEITLFIVCIMKRLLVVTEDDNGEIRFDTDLRIKDIRDIPTLAGMLAFNMVTRLWGGNETMVLAVIRNLAIADLAVSVNRKEMLTFLDQASADVASAVFASFEEMKTEGGNVTMFAPGVKPDKKNS